MGILELASQVKRMNKTLSVILLAKKWLKKRQKPTTMFEDQSTVTELSDRREIVHKRKLNKSVSYNIGPESSHDETHRLSHFNDSDKGVKFEEEISHRKQRKQQETKGRKLSQSKRKCSLKERKLRKTQSLCNSCPDLSIALERRKSKNIEGEKDSSITCCSSDLYVIDK